MTWDPTLYLRFAGERTRPAMDLVARIEVAHPACVVDLGCGPGNSTAILRQRWPQAAITGLDNSPDMIAEAARAFPAGEWVQADVAAWTDDTRYDVVFSNAVLQWLPDHARLLGRLMAQVAPGGALAVQVPAHYDSPLHAVAREVAATGPWRDRMEATHSVFTRGSARGYYDILQPLASRLDIWETEYFHVLDNHRAMLDWFRATGLRPYLAALETAEEKQEFEHRVLEGYTRAYPTQRDGRVPLPFRRLFAIAYAE